MGQVGNGSTVPISVGGVTTPTSVLTSVKQVALGGQHTCVIKTDGNLYCWGSDAYGQLGDGTTNDTDAPGAAVPGLSDVLEVVSGHASTCARTATAVYCWGFNGAGEVGNGNLTNQPSPTQVTGLTGVTQLALGENHAGAITASGLYMWGADSDGQLANGMMVADVPMPAAISSVSNLAMLSLSWSSSCGLTTSGQVLCWGDDTYGELGNGMMSTMSATAVPVIWP